MGERRPLKAVQKVLIVATATFLNVPALVFIFCYSRAFSPRQVGAVGLMNLLLGVPLLALISEKWIRKVK
jgi:ABC-type amino acid transport system permease subunit